MCDKTNSSTSYVVHENSKNPSIKEYDLISDKKSNFSVVDTHDMPCACNSIASTSKPPIVININHSQLTSSSKSNQSTTNFNVNHLQPSSKLNSGDSIVGGGGSSSGDGGKTNTGDCYRVKNSSKHSPSVVNHINICINNNFKPEPETMTDNIKTLTFNRDNDDDDDNDDEDEDNVYHKLSRISDKLKTTNLVKMEATDCTQKQDNNDDADCHSFIVRQSALKLPQKSPPLSTQQNQYKIGDEVLVKTMGDKFALGIISEFENNHCLVRFDNDTEKWATINCLEKFYNDDGDVTLVCIGCKNENDPDEVITCKICERGLHEKCRIGFCTDLNGGWYCSKCTKESGFAEMAQRPKPCKRARRDSILIMPTKVDLYFQWIQEVNSLSWDKHHRINKEQKYCYCSMNGKWYMQMIQCNRCHQWFHENCVQILTLPLYCGDRFYVFICLKCNPKDGEFMRRIKISVQDTVHLLLYSLTIHSSRRFFNLKKVIVPYALDNWQLLQLPPCTSKWPVEKIGIRIAKALKSNKKLFQFREIKTDSNVIDLEYGLVESLPPDMVKISLPPSTVPPDHFMKQFIFKNYGFHLLPKGSSCLSKMQNSDSRIRNLMTGIKYAQLITYDESNVALSYETSASDSDSDFEGFSAKSSKAQLLKQAAVSTAIVSSSPTQKQSLSSPPISRITLSPIADNNIVTTQQNISTDSHTTTDVYEFRITDDVSSLTPPPRRKRGRPRNLPQSSSKSVDSETQTILQKSPKQLTNCSTINNISDTFNESGFASETPSSSTPSATTAAKSNDRKSLEKDIVIDEQTKEQTLSANTQCVAGVIDLCDDSSDETATRSSSLDLIIPPPKNFHGCNNPFLSPIKSDKHDNIEMQLKFKQNLPPRRTLSSSSSSNSSVSSGNNNQPLSLFGNRNFKKGQYCVVRTIKRRLNANDIVIGPNMEVKRKKNRRRSSNDHVEVISTSTIPYTKFLSKDVQIAAMRASSKGPSSTSASTSSSASTTPIGTLNAPFASLAAAATAVATNRPVSQFVSRRLRKRGAKNYAENIRSNNTSVSGNIVLPISELASTSSSSIVTSPPTNLSVSGGGNISVTDLQSTVTEYFGAANRIENGEKFSVKGKRITTDGKVEYLIEWQDIC